VFCALLRCRGVSIFVVVNCACSVVFAAFSVLCSAFRVFSAFLVLRYRGVVTFCIVANCAVIAFSVLHSAVTVFGVLYSAGVALSVYSAVL